MLVGFESFGCENAPYQGQTLTAKQINHILSQHALWLQDNLQVDPKLENSKYSETPNYSDPRRANLCGALLIGADLNNADLSLADLRQADLSATNLSKAKLHRAWLDNAVLHNARLIEADLSKAYLYDAVMSQADLRQVNAQEAQLLGADLSEAVLNNAIFTQANFEKAKLIKVEANYADFTQATFVEADLSQATFAYANLTDAALQSSNLTQTKLTETVMSKALLHNANMMETIYFPKYGTAPDIIGLSIAEHFKTVTYYDPRMGAPALVELREAYRTAGMRQMERLMVYLLKSGERKANWEAGGWAKVGSGLSYILFELPSSYGLTPQRPLTLVMIMFLIFTIIYWIGLSTGLGHPFLEIRWPPKYVTKRNTLNIMKGDTRRSSNVCVTIDEDGWLRRYPRRLSDKTLKGFKTGRLKRKIRLLKISFHLSLLSAFQIGWGWRELNIGLWITNFQTHQYFYYTRGWVRQVGGAQSVLSFYMFVLWASTQFGRPFG
jgi:uncharacterized protein YjbI with pentapeptide repeats